MRRSPDQLPLLDAPAFIGGPARLPRARVARSAAPATLPLLFEARPVDGRSAGVGRSQALLRARLEPRPPAPPVPPSAPEPVEESLEEAGGEAVFVRTRAAGRDPRDHVLDALAEALEGHRRGAAAEVFQQGLGLRVTLQARALSVRWTCGASRSRWLAVVRRVAGEHGFIETD